MLHRKHIKSPFLASPPTPPTRGCSRQIRRSCKSILLLSMAVLVSLILLFFAADSSLAKCPAKPHVSVSDYSVVREVCKASRDPAPCEASLSSQTQSGDVLGALETAVGVSSENRDLGRGMVQEILDSSADDFNRSRAASLCIQLLGYSAYRADSAAGALSRREIKDARAWMSAALAYHYDCWSGLKYVNDSAQVGKAMAFFNDTVIKSTADALAMIANYDNFGEETGSWSPTKTERDGFWPTATESSGAGFVGGIPAGLKPDLTVCKGGCDYSTVQEAVNASPDNLPAGNRFVIWIKSGVYEETVRVPFQKRNLVFLGDGMGNTIITGSGNVGQPGVTTYNTATVGVSGDGFMATGITIQNTAGPDAHQAVAFRSDSDLSVLDGCEFIGNQDTLYAHTLRQYFRSCRIQGNVDFIFGNAAGFFQDCLILIAPRQANPQRGESNAVTAHGRTDPSQSTGFVFRNCTINGTDAYVALYESGPSVHRNYLGRPWKEYSRTVFVGCTMGALIRPEGWMPWSGEFALRTLYYGEFGNAGPGADTAGRVGWSSVIPAADVEAYSVENFIQGDRWIPVTGW